MANKTKTTAKIRSIVKAKAKRLDEYNIKNYFQDIAFLGALRIKESSKDWIATKMYELRASANVYELNMADFLMDMHIKFIHQAPFVFYGKKIYFTDFYLPEYRMVIEIDGSYHNGYFQSKYDKERDDSFFGIRIRTLRISNKETTCSNTLKLRLSQYIAKLR